MAEPTDLTLGVTCGIDAPRRVVWRCWTEPDLLARWFCPEPWRVAEARIDPRPGGRFDTVMAGPDGERMEGIGCFLEVVPERRLVFTDAFAEGFWPRPESFMTTVVELSDADGGGTRLVWTARHATTVARDGHLAMGFEAGWSAAADQLSALARSLDDAPGP